MLSQLKNSRYLAFYGALLLILCGIFRSTDLFFRIPVMSSIPVIVIVMWEHIICSIVLIPVVFRYRYQYSFINSKDFLLFLLIGCGSSALGIFFFTKAFSYLNPALVILLQKLQPVITITLGFIFLKERMSKRFFFLVPIAVISSYFVSFSTVSPFTGEWNSLAKGVLYTVLAAVFWGSGTVWGKMLLKDYNKNFVLANRFLIGAVFTVIMCIILSGNQGVTSFILLDKTVFFKIIYMALIPGLIATAFFYYGLNIVSASLASILELVFPLSSVLIMWIFFNKPLDGVQITASLVLFVSIIMITRKPSGASDSCA